MATKTEKRDDRGGRSGSGGTAAGALAKGLLLAGAAAGAAAAANAYLFYKTPPLTSKLPGGEVRYFPTPDGDVFYKKAGDGPPLLLVHGIGAGASSYEFRNVFAPLAEKHTVYALDLLGFGKSDKPAIPYTAETYIRLIDDFARQVMGVGDGRGEADVIATSLSAAYVVALARRDPSLFQHLVLICPTGIEELASEPGAAAAAARSALKAPILGPTLYNLIASRAYIRSYLSQKVYADPSRATDDVVNEYYVAAHQPGGDNVLPSFLSGLLNVDITDDFAHVTDDHPLLVWGRAARQTPLSQSEAFLQANPKTKLEVIEDAGLLPQEEQPEAFLAAVRPFLAGSSDILSASSSAPAA